MKVSVFEQIQGLLSESGIEFSLTEHAPVRTSEEAARVRGVEIKTGAKAMVVKAHNKYYLFILPGDKRIDWKKAKAILNVKEIRFATEQEAESITGVKMGSVPPFGNVLNLPAFFDQALLENEYVNFNPGSITHSVQIKSYDLMSITNPTLTSFT